MTAMPLLAVTLLAQVPATPAPMPTTPDGCLVAARDFTRTEQRALKQLTADAVRKIEADKIVLAQKCAAQFDPATIGAADLASLIALYGEAAQPALARATLDRALGLKSLATADRAAALSQAVMSGLREPKSPERNARLESYVDQLDRSGAMSAADIASVRTAIDSKNKGKIKKAAKTVEKSMTSSNPIDAARLHALADILKNPSM